MGDTAPSDVMAAALSAFEAHDIPGCAKALAPYVGSRCIPALMLLRTLRLSYPRVCAAQGIAASAEELTRQVNEAPDEAYAAMESFLERLPAGSKAGAFLRASWLSFARGNAEAAQPLYAEAAEAIPSAKVNMAAYMENSCGDGAAAFRLYSEAAAADGHAMAQNNRALILLHGKYGVTQDVPEAVRVLHDLADAGLSEAQYVLGLWILDNESAARGVELLKRAAEQGHERAMLRLAQCYHTGRGSEVKQDPALAVRYYDLAAREGNAEAQYCLACCYQEGFGVPEKDSCEAAVLLHLAVQQGHPGALLNLGICYKTGKGVPVNHTVAANLFKAAAEKGKTVAMCNLAMCYKTGKGVEKDEAKSRELFEKAAALGDTNAKRFLDSIK